MLAPLGKRKKLMSWVRPGVLLTKASRVCPARVLMALDLPALERPAKAISGAAADAGGKLIGLATEVSKTAWRNSEDDMGHAG